MNKFLSVVANMLSAMFLVLSCVACSPPDNDVLATYGEYGTYSFQEFDAYMAALPSSQNSPDSSNIKHWWRERLLQGVQTKLLTEEMDLLQVRKQDAYRKVIRAFVRNVVVAEWVLEHVPSPDISREQLIQAYERGQAQGQWKEPAQRLVATIYLPFAQDNDEALIEEQAEKIYQQIQSGYPFEDMAREHSKSETRLTGGILGWMQKAQISPDFDRLIWAASPPAVLDPVRTSDGMHIFKVLQEKPEVALSFETVQPLLMRTMMAEYITTQVQSLIAPYIQGATIYQMPLDQLRQAYRDGRNAMVVLSVNDFSLPFSSLRQSQPVFDAPKIRELLSKTLEKELVYQYILNAPDESVLDQTAKQQLQSLLLQQYLKERQKQWLMTQYEWLGKHHQAHISRFTTPEKWDVTLAAANIGDQPQHAQKAFIAALQHPASATIEVTQNALKSVTLAALGRDFPKAVYALRELPMQQWSLPWQRGQQFVSIRVDGKTPAEVRSVSDLQSPIVMSILQLEPEAVDQGFTQGIQQEYAISMEESNLRRFVCDKSGVLCK